MKKKMMIGIFAGILLAGLMSAALTPFLSEPVFGAVEFEGPVFYLTNESAQGEAPDVAYRLLTNNIPSEKRIINFTDGSGWDATYFVTKDLGIDEFYQTEFNAHLWIKTNNTEDSDPLLNVTIMRLDDEGNSRVICNDSTEIGGKTRHTHNHFSCSSNDVMDMSDTPKFSLKLMGEEGIEYSMQPGNEYTQDGEPAYDRMEVTAA